MVLSPRLSETEEFVVLRFFVGPELGSEIFVELGSAEGLAEEDELKILVEVELEVRVVLLDSSDFSDELLDQQGKSDLASD